MKLTIFAILVASALAMADVTHYHGYTVYRLKPSNVLQLSFLQGLQDEGVDFWREPDQVNRIADAMLSPEQKEKVLKQLETAGIEYEVMIPDVEKSLEEERREMFQARQATPLGRAVTRDTEAIPNFWTTYQRYDTHVQFADALIAQNGAIVQKIHFGKSYEQRDLFAIRIGVNQGASNKKAIWIEGGIHAREWISPATVTYFAQQLVNKYSAGDADVADILGYFDFYIVPILNVDGYEFTHTSTRLWRKTRRPNSGSTCIGTDPNRNFGYEWGGAGSSNNPCSEIFRGEKAFSEQEVKAETDYILANLQGKIVSFLSVHSYGQYFLYPWGYTSALTKDDAEINRVAKIAVAALNQVSPSTKFTIGTSTNVLSVGAGGADDWSYGSASALYSYTVELRDTGTYGFRLPANQILGTAQETTAAFIALAKEIKAKLG